MIPLTFPPLPPKTPSRPAPRRPAGTPIRHAIRVTVISVEEEKDFFVLTYRYRNGDGAQRTLKQSRRAAPPSKPGQNGILYITMDDVPTENEPNFIFPLPCFSKV